MIIFIILVIVVISIIALLLYGIFHLIKFAFFDYKKYEEITATITEVNRKDNVDRLGHITSYCYDVMCEFYYNGEVLKKKITNDYRVESIPKVGDKINCFYYAKKDYVTNVDARESSKNIKKFLIVTVLLISFLILFTVNLGSDMFQALLCIGGSLVSFYFCYDMIKDNLDISDNKYEEFDATITGIHEKTDTGTGDSIDHTYYLPEITFTYNNEQKAFIDSVSINPKEYHVGDTYKIYFDPEKKTIHRKSNYIFVIALIGLGIFFLYVAYGFLF